MGRKVKKQEDIKPSIEKRTYYAVMKLFKWESMALEQVGKYKFPFPIQMAKPEGGEIGYIPIFDSMESAIKFNGGKVENISILQDV